MGLPLDTRTLQFIDRWIGMVVCGVLSLARLTLGGRRAESRTRKPTKILFVKFAEQGSTVLAYQAISRAIGLVGRENIYFLVFQENRFILDLMNLIPKENVITVSHKNLLDAGLNALRALSRIRQLNIDAAIDLEFFSRSSAALTFLSGAKSRVGFHTFFGDGPYRGDLMTHRLLSNPYTHTSQMFEAMVEALTRDPAMLPTFDFKPPATQSFAKFNPAPGEAAEMDALLQHENPAVGSAPLILLNPNASDLLPLRRWPPVRYVELSRRLLERYPDLFIAFTGAPADATANDRLAAEVSSNRV